jgi:hypothetical protein
MRNLIKLSLVTILFFVALSTHAQAPEAFHYQAVLRNSTGALMANQLVELRFSVRQTTPTGTVEYQETKTLTTNQYGLANHSVGTGSVVSGTFAGVTWGAGEKYLQVEVNAGSGFVDLGAEKLQSVPYALHSKTADNVVGLPWTVLGNNVYNNNSGNVGIGTSLPNAKFHINSAAGNTAFRVQVAGNTKLVVDDNGGVSVGLSVTPPANGLHVAGFIGAATYTPESDFHIKQSTGSGTVQGTAGITLENVTYHWRIYNSSPYVRFNYSSDNGATYTAKAYVSNTDGSWNQLSDASLKKNIQAFSTVLPSVMQLEPLRYHYLDQKENSPKAMGFLAQDVQKIFPDVVSKEEGETLLGIDYSKFAIISIKAIQEQQTQIEALQKQLTEKDAQNTALQSRLEKIEALLNINGSK